MYSPFAVGAGSNPVEYLVCGGLRRPLSCLQFYATTTRQRAGQLGERCIARHHRDRCGDTDISGLVLLAKPHIFKHVVYTFYHSGSRRAAPHVSRRDCGSGVSFSWAAPMRVIPSMTFFVMWASAACAHSPITSDGSGRWAAWLSASLLLAFWSAYLLGQRRRPTSKTVAGAFHATSLLAALTLLGPLDHWAESSTAAHMIQHMLLMVVIAPIWVLCRPFPQLVAGTRLSLHLWTPMLRLSRHPLTCAYIHGAVIWFWHTPYYYMLALRNPWWHVVEHACFITSAGLFWWAILNSSYKRAPWGFLALLFTLMHTGFLGALLTFAKAPLYSEARSLQDQQLAGLIMWVCGGIPYVAAACWLALRWYGQMLRRA